MPCLAPIVLLALSTGSAARVDASEPYFAGAHAEAIDPPPRYSSASQDEDELGDSLPRFGLAHVDLMDLHLSRRPDGGADRQEVLSAEEISDRYAKAKSSGAGWNRWSLYWDLVEREAGVFDWAVPDGIVERDRAAGLRTLAILQGTPGFHAGVQAEALDRTSSAQALTKSLAPFLNPRRMAARAAVPLSPPPKNLDAAIFRARDGGLTDDPTAAASVNPDNPWARYVEAAVDRYRPGGVLASARGWPEGEGVRAWEIGNEPNLSHFWSGTAAQYARFLEVAFLVIERIDPAATVAHAGIASDSNSASWYGEFLDALKSKAASSPLVERYGWYFDKAAWHWYTYPNQLVNGPKQARGLLAGRGLPAKPIWVTEMGIPVWNEHPGPCWDPTSQWRATAYEQAGYVWQAFTEAIATDVEVAFYFQLYDDCGNGPTSYDAFGAVRNHASNQCWTPPEGQACWPRNPDLDGRPRPAHAALAVLSAETEGSSLLWRPDRDANFTQRILLYRPPDKRVTVVWNWLRSEQTAEFFSTGPEGELIRLSESGEVTRETVRPESARYRLVMPPATNRNNPGDQTTVMAGMPSILVETDTAPPFRAGLDPLPETSEAPLTLVAEAADGGTGVAAVQVFAARTPPTSEDDWEAIGPEWAWTESPLTGRMGLEIRPIGEGEIFLALRAKDRAGNWTALPMEAHARTRIIAGGELPSATPTQESGSTATPTSSPTATELASPAPTSSEATATRDPALRPGAYLPRLSLHDGAQMEVDLNRPAWSEQEHSR